MITAKQRKGKDLHDFTVSELIEEFRAMNIEGARTAMVWIELKLSEDQQKALEAKCKEFEDYKKEVACEFISRFLK
jgi:hypothetical protein